jgi:hypothetical protein
MNSHVTLNHIKISPLSSEEAVSKGSQAEAM